MSQSEAGRTTREERADALDRAIRVGRDRLHRSPPELLATGLIAGGDVGVGVLALLLVEHETGSRLLGGLAFTLGFIALMLGKAELFDENYLVPVTAVAADRRGLWPLIRLWTGTAAMNLLGGWIFAGLTAGAVTYLEPTAIKVAEFYATLGLDWQSFALALLGGGVITLMTWMEKASVADLGKIAAALMGGFVIAGAPLNHVIVMSLEMFVALHFGAPFSYADWAAIAGWVTVGNILGGVAMVTLLRLVQISPDTVPWRQLGSRLRRRQ